MARHARLRSPGERGGIRPSPARRGRLRKPRVLQIFCQGADDDAEGGLSMGTTYCDVAPGHEWHGPYHEPNTASRSRRRGALRAAGARDRIRPACPGSPSSRSARHSAAPTAGSIPRSWPAYRARDRRRLLADPGIIRNRLKVDAAIANAATILELRDDHGSFAALARRAPSAVQGRVGEALQADLPLHRRRDRRGVLMSIGYLPGAHAPRAVQSIRRCSRSRLDGLGRTVGPFPHHLVIDGA